MSTKSKMRGVLIYVSGDRKREMIKLRRDGTIFGREKADIIIDDTEVSSTHFQIQNIDESYHIFDMNSSNGTFLNDQKIIKATLKEGDELRVGQTKFHFSLKEEKSVRNIPTLLQGSQSKSHNSIVDTLIAEELQSNRSVLFVVKIVYGNGESESVDISQRETFVGRASTFGKFDQDPEISRRHLKIKLNTSGEIFVEDQGSTNGSYLNGRRIKGIHRVKGTDSISVGSCKIQIKTLV